MKKALIALLFSAVCASAQTALSVNKSTGAITAPVTAATFKSANSIAGTATTITIAGTSNEITLSAGAQDLSANRTWTVSLPTALTFNGKTVTGGTYVSPAVTTSLTTGSTTFALLNTTATTVNAFGAATAVNMGAAASIVFNFGGSTTAGEFRFLEPSGSGTNYTAFKAVAQGANITYSLPATVGAAGTFLKDAAGDGILSWAAPTAAAAGSDTHVQYNDGGTALGGEAAFTYNKATNTLTIENLTVTGALTAGAIDGGATPSVTAFGQLSSDNNAWAASHGALVFHDGTAATFIVGTTATDTPSNGQVPTWNTGGTITWETPSGSGTVTVVSSGSLTSTALVTGGGTTTLQTPSATSTLDSSGNVAFAGTGSATRFLPTGTTVPTNGLYLPAANTLGWGINSAAEMQLTATALSPAADGGNSLGTTALGWQNIFGNTAFVLNIENGDWVATHTAGILTVGTGDLRVTTAGTNAASVTTRGSSPTWSGIHTFTPTARSSGVASYLTITTPADTGQTASTESIGINKTAATRTWATGALTTQREVLFAAPTYAFAGGSTLTTAVNVDIADPIAGTNATLTNTYGLRVNNQKVTGTLTANTGTNLIGPLVDSVDGTTPLNNVIQTVASGTAYTMTTSYATVDFGTTDPVVTLTNAGTYTISADIQTSLVSATTTTQTESFKLRRTNNTAADLTGATFGTPLPVATAGSPLGPCIHIGPIKYTTTNTDDAITIQGILSASLGAGSVTVTNVTITAERKY